MISLYKSASSVVIVNEIINSENMSGVRVSSVDNGNGEYSKYWSVKRFKKIRGTIDIKIDNETFFYFEKEKTIYIKDPYDSNSSKIFWSFINLSNGNFNTLNSYKGKTLSTLQSESIKDTIVKLKFK